MRAPALILGVALLVAPLTACDDDGETGTQPPETRTFQVRVQNVSQTFDFIDSGVFNTPEGSASPGPLVPGGTYRFEFNAGPGHRISFATMFVPSNDLFYAPSEEGIPLYDDEGDPISGNVTDQVLLWDAGTEVNQEPGLGEDQPMRQDGPDTGADDPDPTVRLAEDAFGNLPPVSEVVRVTIESLEGTRFALVIENVSDGSTLETSDGETQPVPLAPGVAVVHGSDQPLFAAGSRDAGEGLEGLAEDGTPGTLAQRVADRTGLTSPLAPGVWATHMDPNVLFAAGAPDRDEGLEPLAEDGSPSALAATMQEYQSRGGVTGYGAFATPEGADGPGPLLPGSSYLFTVVARPGDRLSLATMLVQTNDLFYAPDPEGIPLFQGGSAVSGDVTDQLQLWDAGTEVNEHPGTGLNQAPRQSGPDTGPAENGNVGLVDDGYEYPAVEDVIRVTVTPSGS